jgi:hypothetical protein
MYGRSATSSSSGLVEKWRSYWRRRNVLPYCVEATSVKEGVCVRSRDCVVVREFEFEALCRKGRSVGYRCRQ